MIAEFCPQLNDLVRIFNKLVIENKNKIKKMKSSITLVAMMASANAIYVQKIEKP